MPRVEACYPLSFKFPSWCIIAFSMCSISDCCSSSFSRRFSSCWICDSCTGETELRPCSRVLRCAGVIVIADAVKLEDVARISLRSSEICCSELLVIVTSLLSDDIAFTDGASCSSSSSSVSSTCKRLG